MSRYVVVGPTPEKPGNCMVCETVMPYKIAVYSSLCEPCLNEARAASGYTESWRPPPGPPPPPSVCDTWGLAGFYADWDAQKRPAPANMATVIPLRISPAYVKAAFDNEISILAATRPGSRNGQLNQSSFALGQLIGAGVLAEAGTIDALTRTARDIGLPESEIQATIASGIGAGKAQPRRQVG
jgi:hypothetical protein